MWDCKWVQLPVVALTCVLLVGCSSEERDSFVAHASINGTDQLTLSTEPVQLTGSFLPWATHEVRLKNVSSHSLTIDPIRQGAVDKDQELFISFGPGCYFTGMPIEVKPSTGKLVSPCLGDDPTKVTIEPGQTLTQDVILQREESGLPQLRPGTHVITLPMVVTANGQSQGVHASLTYGISEAALSAPRRSTSL